MKNNKILIILLSLFGCILIIGIVLFYGNIKSDLEKKILSNSGKTTIETWKSFEVYGIDVSKFQGKVDWKKVKNEGVSFSFIKATYGSVKKDTQFKTNWDKSKEHAIIRGAYHFFLPGHDIETQATNFFNLVKLEKGDLPPVLDIEVKKGVTDKEFIERTIQIIELFKKHYGVLPIIYTNTKLYHDFFKKYLSNNLVIWIAHYKVNQPSLHENDWHFWQLTETGRVKGVNNYVDLNVFNGDIEDLYEICL